MKLPFRFRICIFFKSPAQAALAMYKGTFSGEKEARYSERFINFINIYQTIVNLLVKFDLFPRVA